MESGRNLCDVSNSRPRRTSWSMSQRTRLEAPTHAAYCSVWTGIGVVISFLSFVYRFDAFSSHVSCRLQLWSARGATTMPERPDELLGRSPGLIALQTGRKNSPAVHRTKWMRSPRF